MSVLLQINETVATVRLNRPEALNSLDRALVDELLEILDRLENDRSIRVVILTGTGRAFCAGGDLTYIREHLTTEAEAGAFIGRVGQAVSRLHHLSCPTVAMVGGVAAGAGANLALACDLIYCSASARFGQSFARVGLIPDAGGHYFLPRAVGLARAKELMFTGGLIDAAAAYELGLVNRVLADEEQLAEAVEALAAELAAGPPLALAAIKRHLNLSLESSLEQMLELECAGQARALMSEDGREGLAAFAEKRKPAFKGR